ncbi:MAG: transposase [Bacteroidia bacterium]
MAEKFQNKYRIPSARAAFWDYRWKGAYFITICTKNRLHYFGEIENGKMVLSNAGVLADVFWHEIKNHAQNIALGEFVVMPNHIHGILILNGDGNSGITSESSESSESVETTHALSLQSSQKPSQKPSQKSSPQPIEPESPTEIEHPIEFEQPKTIGQQRFQNQGKNSVSAIIGGYKSAVTKHANRLGIDFAWQPRFHDRIIRDAAAFERISNYIINNPINWDNDTFRGKI